MAGLLKRSTSIMEETPNVIDRSVSASASGAIPKSATLLSEPSSKIFVSEAECGKTSSVIDSSPNTVGISETPRRVIFKTPLKVAVEDIPTELHSPLEVSVPVHEEITVDVHEVTVPELLNLVAPEVNSSIDTHTAVSEGTWPKSETSPTSPIISPEETSPPLKNVEPEMSPSKISESEMSQISKMSQPEMSQIFKMSQPEMSQISKMSQPEMSQISKMSQPEMSQTPKMSESDLSQNSKSESEMSHTSAEASSSFASKNDPRGITRGGLKDEKEPSIGDRLVKITKTGIMTHCGEFYRNDENRDAKLDAIEIVATGMSSIMAEILRILTGDCRAMAMMLPIPYGGNQKITANLALDSRKVHTALGIARSAKENTTSTDGCTSSKENEVPYTNMSESEVHDEPTEMSHDDEMAENHCEEENRGRVMNQEEKEAINYKEIARQLVEDWCVKERRQEMMIETEILRWIKARSDWRSKTFATLMFLLRQCLCGGEDFNTEDFKQKVANLLTPSENSEEKEAMVDSDIETDEGEMEVTNDKAETVPQVLNVPEDLRKFYKN